jgi:squalene-associated FAD-dependent desaturase
MAPRHVAVVGGGWAGCAASAELARLGHRVTLLEAGSELGGRARRLELDLDGQRHVLDNGQHLLIGAYTATAALLKQVGGDLEAAFARRPFEIAYPDGFHVRAARLPAPWHLAIALLRARGLDWADRTALAAFVPRARRLHWAVVPDRSAQDWLAELGQTPRLIERIWRPLTLAALNTPLARASARVLATVLRDSLGASESASEMWLPRSNLSAFLPEAVERYVLAQGGAVLRNQRVDLARRSGGGWSLAIRSSGDHAAREVDGVVYAAPAAQLQRVFGLHVEALRSELRLIERFSYQPITTVYLKYARDAMPRFPATFTALLEDSSRRHHGQWVFNRGALDAANCGVLAVVISTGGTHEEPTLDALCEAAARQMTDCFGLPAPRAARAIIERRATLSCVPDLDRPSTTTALPNLALAGDWTASEYPCTLESAVRSGLTAARALGAELGRSG